MRAELRSYRRDRFSKHSQSSSVRSSYDHGTISYGSSSAVFVKTREIPAAHCLLITRRCGERLITPNHDGDWETCCSEQVRPKRHSHNCALLFTAIRHCCQD